MKRYLFIGIAAAVIGGGLFWFLRNGNPQRGRGGETSRKIAAAEGPIEEMVEATGEVAALNRVEIKPPIQGRIEKLLVEEGDSMKEGQILAWMSSSDRAAIIDAARAKGMKELKRWEDTYKPTPIVAPMPGVVILRNVVLGQTVDASAVLFAMADKLIVIARVDETDIGRVRIGMPARITLDSYPDQPIGGHVFNILYEGKNISNVITYGVKVEPKNVPAFFRSQMTANVSLVVSAKENAVLIPAIAVSEDRSGEKRVFIPDPNGKPITQMVKTGLESGENIEILEGLKAGDPVLILRGRYAPQRGTTSPLIPTGRRREREREDRKR